MLTQRENVSASRFPKPFTQWAQVSQRGEGIELHI